MSNDAPDLVVDGLTKRFDDGAVTAVDDLSFTVEPGSVVGLLGPNGAGKTTTIKSILGLVIPDSGSVEVGGVDVHDRPRLAHRQIDAMLEGARNNYWRLTVEENLRYFAGISGLDPDAVLEECDEILQRFEIDEKRDEVVRNLSRGMKQKVSLASVLVTDASIVCIDEPTLGLDVESTRQLKKELRNTIDQQDMTVLLSSHDMDVIEDVCDRVIIMHALAKEIVDSDGWS
ncbi:ATP-binding cassette domain-containing protein [Halomicrobium sp. ZPS1]|uniref:ABC transporter related n=2 Tax=Halomicrobium mukohataei TaxID=57705 RepID=C7P0M0_HALMD|nr:ABC transporter related [Halomicrobium mukohataei DSM 12286]QCD65496.1 ABC transporter ATP-binding protein [Halomicrobium mukohataei]QFR20302.1 ATP-binding cassette domain-containing protein [Halomicrobium sp. ZPS1]